MAALLCTEVIAEDLDTHQDVIMAALDTEKAFDTVSHIILKCKLYDVNRDSTLWSLESSLLDGLSVKVRLHGMLSDPIPIRQEVGQGKVLSLAHYKRYIDDHLEALTNSRAGARIGFIDAGSPA